MTPCDVASSYELLDPDVRLRFLDAKAIATEFEGLLTQGEMRMLLHRRNSILGYFDELVGRQGYAATVIH